MNERFKLSIILLALCMAGCQQDKEDLLAYVARVKEQQKSDIPPIPVMKPYEKFDYAAADMRDPFIPTVIEVPDAEPKQMVDNGISPDKNRRKEALEIYELSELEYVGTLEQDQIWALVRALDGVIHRVQIGNYIGKNDGKIESISESELVLEEIIPNGQGGYEKRKTTVAAVEVR